jgi:serine/threonine-protein kinase HipA
MNPVPDSYGLRLNISEADNSLSLELARSVAHYFRVPAETARDIIERSQSVVRQWPMIARRLRLPERTHDQMASAFRLAG